MTERKIWFEPEGTFPRYKRKGNINIRQSVADPYKSSTKTPFFDEKEEPHVRLLSKELTNL